MTLVKLRNGAEVPEAVVAVTMRSLTTVFNTNPLLMAEILLKAESQDWLLFEDSEQKLKDISLVQDDGNMHEDVRNIILAATEGSDLRSNNISLLDPVLAP